MSSTKVLLFTFCLILSKCKFLRQWDALRMAEKQLFETTLDPFAKTLKCCVTIAFELFLLAFSNFFKQINVLSLFSHFLKHFNLEFSQNHNAAGEKQV